MIGRIVQFIKRVIEDDKKYQQSEAYFHHTRMKRKIMRNCPLNQKKAKLQAVQLSLCRSLNTRDQQNTSNLDEE
jgi:hypothetical protein